jgi:hypothetical protein
MKFEYFNDTGSRVKIHPATWHYCKLGSKEDITPLEIRQFETMKDGILELKAWGNTIFVSVRTEEVE